MITNAYTSCLMYATKTRHTEDIVRPIIENHAANLIIENSGYNPPVSLALARAQALLLYQSIREPQYVERDLPILEKWIEYLTNLRDRTRGIMSMDVMTNPESWDSWIFWECVSRTILAASYFVNVHCLIARGEHPLGEWKRPHMWTASKRLWSAETSQEFYERWQKKKPITVCNIFLNNLLKYSSGEEVDAFASMLMVPTLGLAGTKKWIEETKGRIEELDPTLP